jgi:hypothetical protein
MTIADFVTDRMTNYLAGGMSQATAQDFTRSELLSMYGGYNESKDDAGNWITTPPPEPMSREEAIKAVDVALAAYLSKVSPDAPESPIIAPNDQEHEITPAKPDTTAKLVIPRQPRRKALDALDEYIRRSA